MQLFFFTYFIENIFLMVDSLFIKLLLFLSWTKDKYMKVIDWNEINKPSLNRDFSLHSDKYIRERTNKDKETKMRYFRRSSQMCVGYINEKNAQCRKINQNKKQICTTIK